METPSKMVYPKIKISYWPIGARSTGSRAALTYKDIPFEFVGVNFRDATVNEDRARFPLGDIPVLEATNEDGSSHTFCESIAVNHYVGNLTGLWPKDDVQQNSLVLEAYLTYDLCLSGSPWDKDDANYMMTYAMDAEAAKKAKAGPVTRRFKFYLTRINEIVAKFGVEITMFDVSLTGTVLSAKSGYFGEVDFSYLPDLKAIQNRVDLVMAEEKLIAAIKQVIGAK